MRFFQLLNEKFYEIKPYSYSNNINSFNSFIMEKGFTEENIKTYLRGIRTEDILESLKYYINRNDITSKNAARRYSTALKEYLYFMLDSKIIDNSDLLKELELPGYKTESYLSKMNTYIFKNNLLKENESFEALSSEEVEQLILQCNNLLNSDTEYEKAFTSNKYFNKYRSALIIKLILLTGITYRVLLALDKEDLNIVYGTILINGFEIHLPKSLHYHFKMYLNLTNNISTESKRLFINNDGSPMSQKTTLLYDFLKPLIGRGDLNGIIKYSIISMLKKGMNETTIKQVTGVEDKMMTDCFIETFNFKDRVRNFDSMIRSLEIYDKLE